MPLRLYITSKGKAKVELGLARGKQLHDRRRDIADAGCQARRGPRDGRRSARPVAQRCAVTDLPIAGSASRLGAGRSTAVDAHAAGEPGRVIVGGVEDVPGATMFDKMSWLQANRDDLRLRMLREPRGYPAANCNLILPSTHPEADAGYVIMEQVEYPGMSGTNTMCVVTVLLETGMLPMTEPVTEPGSRVARRAHPRLRGVP